jgi:hypothetical protein
VRARRVQVIEEADRPAGSTYASAFEVVPAVTDVRSPEQWARAMFEDAPGVMRWGVMMGWRFIMGFRLGPRPSPDYVLGWKIVTSAPEAIALEVQSSLATAYKVVRVDGPRVVVTTFVRYERTVARVVWATITPVHHRTEPFLLGHAASHPPVPNA